MFRTLSRAILACLIFLQAAIVYAGDNSFFAARREALMKKIEGAVAVLQGAPNTRAYNTFRQDNNFYYLTGVETPGAYLLLDAVRRRSILFLPSRNKEAEKWEGVRLFPGQEACKETGLDEALDVSQLKEELEKTKNSRRTIYTPLSPHETAAVSRDRALQHDFTREKNPWDGRMSRESAFERHLQAAAGGSFTIKDLSPILDEMRRVKDFREIQCLREAGRISSLGLVEAMRATKPGVYEYQIAAVAESLFKWHGALGPSFFPIVASGPNSCLPHYTKNARKMDAGDIVVLDAGADYKYYASDITRTFPVSGRFGAEQAKIYQIVLDAHKAALNKIRPGASFDLLDDIVREVLGRFGYAKYLTHRVSHYVGMAVHDVGESEAFEPGMVIALEPGVYFPEKSLGVRIEDTVLVTKDGYEILTKEAPKEINEIEGLMTGTSIVDAFRLANGCNRK